MTMPTAEPPATPRVTVSIPTHNRARFLRESIASALAQTLTEIEVIVSDNASADETPDVVASFSDPRLRYERLERNIGLHGNLSRALHLGSAPYVTILQDDDLMLPENLERKVAALEAHPQAVLAHAPFRFIDDTGKVLSEAVDWWKSPADVENGPDFVRGQLARGVRADMTSWLLRRSALAGERFDEVDGLAADFGFLLRLAMQGDVVYVRQPLTSTRRHGGSLSVRGAARVLEGGHYAPSFSYTLSSRAAAESFLRRHRDVFPDAARLLRVNRRWARAELAGVVRVQSGDEPALRPTLQVVREAAAADPTVLANRRVALTLAWATLGRRGRSLARRLVRR
jgi:glycosyltransferase involved in cell wall biosynthesis